MRQRVVHVNRGLQLLDAVDGEPVGFGESLQRIELLLIAGGGVGRRLELIGRLPSAFVEIVVRRANLLENRRHEAVGHFARLAEVVDLARQRAPQSRERRHADDRGDQQSREQARQAEDDAPADRHWCASVTSWPPRTTPITTDFAGTSPCASNAIVPVTPSYAGLPPPVPICAIRFRIARRSVPSSVNTVASSCTMSYAPAPRWSGRSPEYARAYASTNRSFRTSGRSGRYAVDRRT